MWTAEVAEDRGGLQQGGVAELDPVHHSHVLSYSKLTFLGLAVEQAPGPSLRDGVSSLRTIAGQSSAFLCALRGPEQIGTVRSKMPLLSSRSVPRVFTKES